MALQFDGVTVGAMQYNGVTIGEAMIDGQIVYRSSIYPIDGEWGPEMAYGQVMASHTVESDGGYTITHTVTGHRFGRARIATPNGQTNGSSGDPSIATTTEYLSTGDVIEFSADTGGFAGTVSGTWSIVKN